MNGQALATGWEGGERRRPGFWSRDRMDGAAVCYSMEKGERIRGKGVRSVLDTWTLRCSEGI